LPQAPDRYLCVHAHFYQPPRENPWLESVEVQDSAYPYHDWNERVSAECYAPNAAARILDGDGRIRTIVNNYSKISFNFGPTLLSWMKENASDVYETIVATDAQTRAQHHGHGSAISQAYNHIIMPLANALDKNTQVIWGIRDFEYRFGRSPEGMWLPEAAVDLESLEALAAHGILFTILSPQSAKRVRPIAKPGDTEPAWEDVSGGRVDPSHAYRVSLPSGRQISVFFYDGPASRAVAFEDILGNGEAFANRLLGTYSESRTWPQLVHIATDGETYGHHKPHGDMALAYAMHHIETNKLARLTNYGEFLEMFPPTHEAQIFENSSWSCAHGIDRWRSNCGCNSGGHPDWNQNWRAPLRDALDWLRDQAAVVFEQRGGEIFCHPWVARDDYIRVVLDRSPHVVDEFLRTHAKAELSAESRMLALKLLEIQRHAVLMYTSCGWFFDELSGIETVQVIQYAARAVQLVDQVAPDKHLEPQFIEKLAQVKGNLRDHPDGKSVYEDFVKPSMLDLQRVGAHYAVSSLFEEFPPESKIYCYTVNREDAKSLFSGRTKLTAGRARISSDITGDFAEVSYGVVHLGDHLITGGVRTFGGIEAFNATLDEITKSFEGGDFADLVRVVDKNYGSGSYTLRLIFRDQQRRIVQQILSSALSEADASYRHLFENRAPLMHFLSALHFPPVRPFQVAAEFTLNADLRSAFEAENGNVQKARAILDEIHRVGVPLDSTTAEFALRKRLEKLAARFRDNPRDMNLLRRFIEEVDLAKATQLNVQFWKVQNFYFDVLNHTYPQIRRARKPKPGSAEWLESFRTLGEKLCFRFD
jgi:alpha-amylase/alpha-mannosidase (GH57 family)